MTRREQIVADVAAAIAGYGVKAVSRGEVATALDVLDALGTSQAFADELVARLGAEGVQGVHDALADAAGVNPNTVGV